MKDYFRTLNPIDKFVGGYDPYNDEYVINLAEDGSPLTLAFQEAIGFTSFYEYQPERMIGINNRMYSIKNGQVWLHDSNTTRNNFYGVQRNAYIQTVFADMPQDVKHFKSVNLESDIIWDASIVTNFGFSTITGAEFSLEEGEYYAYIRQNESTALADTTEDSAMSGIGEISAIAGLVVTINSFELPRAISDGDAIYKYNGETATLIGTVTSVNKLTKQITLSSVTGLIVGDLIMYNKNSRIEGEAMKGYYMTLGLTSSSTADNELFAVKVEAVRSFD
jgi:hypothetical protein